MKCLKKYIKKTFNFFGLEVKKICSTNQLYVQPGHFYSPIVDPYTVDKIFQSFHDVYDLPGIEIDSAQHLKVWNNLLTSIKKYPFSSSKADKFRYYFDNPAYDIGDSAVYFGFILSNQPKRIIEVGSGFSSACALDTIEHFIDHKVSIQFIEPYPNLLKNLVKDSDLSSIKIHACNVQDADVNLFSSLEENDILFIDSTHVLKTGSDVHQELFEILPTLKPGVLIHFHDIFWPFEYPKKWVIDQNRSWNELYALRAFLMYNDTFKIEFFNDYFAKTHRQIIERDYPEILRNPGGGIWLRKIK